MRVCFYKILFLFFGLTKYLIGALIIIKRSFYVSGRNLFLAENKLFVIFKYLE